MALVAIGTPLGQVPGIKLFQVDTAPEHPLGLEVTDTNGTIFRYCRVKAAFTVTAGNLQIMKGMPAAGVTWDVTAESTVGVAGTLLCSWQGDQANGVTSFAGSASVAKYAWFAIGGNVQLNLAVNAGYAASKLYTAASGQATTTAGTIYIVGANPAGVSGTSTGIQWVQAPQGLCTI
jgi:hypothetical protein